MSEEAILSPRKLVAGAGLPLCRAPQAGTSRGQLCRRLAGGGVLRAWTSSLCSRQWGRAVSPGRGSGIRDDLRDWGQVTQGSQGRALKTVRAPGSRLAAGDSLGQRAWGCWRQRGMGEGHRAPGLEDVSRSLCSLSFNLLVCTRGYSQALGPLGAFSKVPGLTWHGWRMRSWVIMGVDCRSWG